MVETLTGREGIPDESARLPSVTRPVSVPEPAPLRNGEPRFNAPSEFKPDPKPGRKP